MVGPHEQSRITRRPSLVYWRRPAAEERLGSERGDRLQARAKHSDLLPGGRSWPKTDRFDFNNNTNVIRSQAGGICVIPPRHERQKVKGVFPLGPRLGLAFKFRLPAAGPWLAGLLVAEVSVDRRKLHKPQTQPNRSIEQLGTIIVSLGSSSCLLSDFIHPPCIYSRSLRSPFSRAACGLPRITYHIIDPPSPPPHKRGDDHSTYHCCCCYCCWTGTICSCLLHFTPLSLLTSYHTRFFDCLFVVSDSSSTIDSSTKLSPKKKLPTPTKLPVHAS
jgi:hypothetical protein